MPRSLRAALLVAADGRASPLREAAGIGVVRWSYRQAGIVTTVRLKQPHQGRAVQHFLPSGPFAVLPLTGNRSSIVWTEEKASGEAIMAADEARFLDEDGTERPLIMGSYGIGPGRVMAAVVEQRHDEQGISWPRAIAPYDVHVVALSGVEDQAEQAARTLEAAGADVLLDDRDARAGEKFADADLIGCPIRVTVGKKTVEDGAVDVRDRESGEERRVPLAELGGIL